MRFHARGLTLKIHPSFWFALLTVVGAMGPGRLITLPGAVAQVLLVVLVRELGHAAALRARPRIFLSWMGGHTSSGRPISLARQLQGLAAGPAATFLLYGVAHTLGLTRLASLALGWGLISCLPIQPQPGGRLVAALLGSSRMARVAADVSSVLLSLLAFLGFLSYGASPFAILVVAMSFPISCARMFDGRRLRHIDALRKQAWVQLAAGDLDGAEQNLQLLPMELDDDALRGAIDLARGKFAAAIGPLADALEEQPSDEAAARFAEALIGLHRLDEATRLLEEPVAGPQLFHHVMAALFYAGRFAEAALVGERSWAMREAPLTAFNLACTRARMNEPEVALSWLDRAIAAGWRNLQDLDEDPDLASLRTRPDWAPLRARLTSLGRVG